MSVRIGLIGGGNISETHARAVEATAGAEVCAIVGINEEKVRRLCERHGGTPYTDFEDFLNHRPMDVVVIGSPSALHAGQGTAAARCGLHVLTEKPLDISVARADALIAETRKAGVKLGVIFQDRMKADIRLAKDWIGRGVLGKPLLADARVKWYRPPNYYAESRWRGRLDLDGGGALINQAVHTVDLLLWMFGDVRSVQAQKRTALHQIEAEDTLVAQMEFVNEGLGVLQASTCAYPGYPRRIEFTGLEGTLIIEHDRLVAADLRTPLSGWRSGGDDRNQSASSAVVSDFRGHQAVLEDFLAAVETGRSPCCTGEEGRRSMVLVEAIYEACRNGRRVDL